MAEVRIPKKRFTSLSFPSVCAVTGLPAAEIFAFEFDGVKGGLPLNQSSVRLVRQQQFTLKALVAGMALLIGIAAYLQSALFMAGSMATGAIVLANFSAIRSRLPRGSIDGKEVVLSNVHPQFVDALDNPPSAHGTGKCSGCPSVAECTDDKVEACDGHAAKQASTTS